MHFGLVPSAAEEYRVTKNCIVVFKVGFAMPVTSMTTSIESEPHGMTSNSSDAPEMVNFWLLELKVKLDGDKLYPLVVLYVAEYSVRLQKPIWNKSNVTTSGLSPIV